MNLIDEIIALAEAYDRERSKGSNADVNSIKFINMYETWYAESKGFFEDYFDLSDTIYSEFISYDRNKNGYGLSANFARQYPLFKVLIHKIKQHKSSKVRKVQRHQVFKKCFVIHGHDDILKFEIARLIERDLGIEATILHEQSNKGQTIIEKFEANKEVDFAVALWTYDDDGKMKADNQFKPRARQNVVFETGFFFGHLGRHKVIVLKAPEVEIPSDYSGIVYISLDGNWKHDLLKEIEGLYS